MNKKTIYLIGSIVLIVAALLVSLLLLLKQDDVKEGVTSGNEVEYYTCGMHPDVRVTPEEYEDGNINCPICNMKLIPVYKESSRETSVKLKNEEDKEKKSEERISYYTCGMHPDVRVTPEEYEDGNINCPICNMKLIPVYEESKDKNSSEKTILFYRHPKDSAVTSKELKTDEEGNEFIPVYEESKEDAHYYGCGMEGEEHIFLIKGIEGLTCPICGMPLKKLSDDDAKKLSGVVGRVKVKAEEVKRIGVKSVPVRKMDLSKVIRTVGRVAYDPELAVAQEEYISAVRAYRKISSSGLSDVKNRSYSLVESARRKLKLLGLSNDQIEELKRTGKIHTSLVLPEKEMWIYGDVYEYELNWIHVGQDVVVTAEAFPGEKFQGVLSSMNPVVDPKTRSVRIRAKVKNPRLKLKPDMYVNLEIKSKYRGDDGAGKVLAIPKKAVLDTGRRKIVWVEKDEGLYEGREVVIGSEATAIVGNVKDDYYPLLRGVKEGERIVVKANFLIDSQSQISGTAASQYGGALDGDEDDTDSEGSMPTGHQH